MNVFDDNRIDDAINAYANFYETYAPLFTKYQEGEPGRPMVSCRTQSRGVTFGGPVVFKIGCPAYVTSDGFVEAIEDDEFYKPVWNVTPVIKNGTTMIPIRPLIDGLINGYTKNKTYSLYATVDYDKNTKKITVNITDSSNNPDCIRNKHIELTIGSSTAYVNGTAYEMNEAAQIIKGKTMIPLRAVGDMLSCDVEWLQDGQYILVTPMSVEALKAKEKAEQRAADPFWSTVERVEIDGKEYYHMPRDPEFWGCEYSFPVVWEGEDERYFPMYFGRSRYELNEVAFDNPWDGSVRYIKDGNSVVIKIKDVIDIDNFGLTVEEFCKKNECYISDFSDNIAITESEWGPSSTKFYHLALKNGKAEAVTQFFAPDNAEKAKVFKEAGIYEPKLDTDKLDPLFVTFLKSFKRRAPNG